MNPLSATNPGVRFQYTDSKSKNREHQTRPER